MPALTKIAMKFIKLLFPAWLLMLGLMQSTYSQYKLSNKDVSVVNDFISRQAKEKSAKECEYCRNILRGDLNNDNKDDLAVLYALDGFKTWPAARYYLAIFTNEGENFIYRDCIQVSEASLQKLVTLESIDDGKVLLQTREPYTRYSDGAIGSHIIKRRFILADGKIKRTDFNL